tara:strand:+ start:851 stop:1033 length:183 start_codon:yes stop_codon:yes gene_type:complete
MEILPEPRCLREKQVNKLHKDLFEVYNASQIRDRGFLDTPLTTDGGLRDRLSVTFNRLLL